MRITGIPGLSELAGTDKLAAASQTALPASPVGSFAAGLQSAVLQPALSAMQQMPDFDQAKVSELRAALARGELPFDAAKLAGLIERFHGGRT